MKKTMLERYESVIPVGSIALCNNFSVSIFEPDKIDRCKDNCDLIAAWWSSERGYHGFHKHLIHYTKTGRAYIKKNGLRIYLDNFMKVM